MSLISSLACPLVLLGYWMGGPDNRDGTSSNHDKMISLHFLIAERSVRAKPQPTVESAQRLGLIDVENEDNGIRSTKRRGPG